jgi:hypothetical protein
LVMVAQRDKQKAAGEKNDDRDADGGSGKELEVKMSLAKERVRDPARKRAPARFRRSRNCGRGRLIYHNY